MAITSDKNGGYGPPLVTGKYSPLLNIQFSGAAGDRAVYAALLNNRWGLLNNAGVLPQTLGLAVPNWAATIASEAGRNSPLVVVSSNRSGWIAAGIRAAAAELLYLGGAAAFADASDLTALGAHAGQTSSPPIYCPTRIGAAGPRSVYIVVHISEYTTYKRALAGLGVTVVGWQFRAPVPRRNLAGFGASRFAAVEFCKTLRTAAAAAASAAATAASLAGGASAAVAAAAGRTAAAAMWNYAWLFDDNVVALTSFPGYALVETAMTNAAAPRVCAGFRGGTDADAFATNWAWARAEVGAGRGVQVAPPLPASVTPAIVQQASLWNIAYLTANHLNFGPAFLTSGEDVSIGNYFNAQGIPYFHYNGIGVTKEVAYSDGATAATTNRARRILAAWFAYAESAGAAGPAVPPPVEILPTAGGDGGVQTLASFIVNCVLPNSLMQADRANVGVQNTAKCQAVEQIACGAINRGFVAGPALAATFQINGAAGNQVVTQVNAP